MDGILIKKEDVRSGKELQAKHKPKKGNIRKHEQNPSTHKPDPNPVDQFTNQENIPLNH
jgi:hypothetical protein